MSDAKASNQDVFSIAVCSQCQQPFPPSTTRDVRHAVPCGHVFCNDCLDRVETEQKSGKSICRRAGCECELALVSEFVPSWAAQRVERIKAKQQGMFPDQGNVGDRPPPTCSECEPDPGTGERHLATHRCETCGDGVYLCAELVATHPKFKALRSHDRVATRSKFKASGGHVVVALEAAPSTGASNEPAWGNCLEHKLPFKAVEAATHRPMCSECVVAARGKVAVETFDEAIAALESAEAASTSAALAMQKAKFAEPTFTPDELCARTAKWGAEETARVRGWEEREVKKLQSVADYANETVRRARAVASEIVQVVQEVCARRLEVGASVFTQRMGLRATLEEFDQALADLPSDPAALLSKKRAVYAERKRLCDLLAGSTIAVPWAWAVIEWDKLPALSAEFDQKEAGGGGVVASAVSAAAKATLGEARTRTPALPSNVGFCEFPVIPKLVRCRRVPGCLRVCFHPLLVVLVVDTCLITSVLS